MVRAAVFGNGFARSVILPCLRHVDRIRVEGIASPNLDRVRETAHRFAIPHAAVDHREILEAVRPDLVFVVSPPHRHAEMAIDALDASAHAVCEKPMALDAKESLRMAEAARSRPSRIAVIDHELRFDPKRVLLGEVVRAGNLGRIRRIEYTLHSPGRRDPEIPWGWWSDASSGGGALGAIGSHAIDALSTLAGSIVEASGRLETFVVERRDPADGEFRAVTSDDFFEAWLRHESGTISSIRVSLVETDRLHRITVTGSEATAVLDEQGPLRLLRGPAAPEVVAVQDDLPPSCELGIPDTDWARSFLRMARLLARAIDSEEATLTGAADFEDGHRTQVVLDAVRRSSAEGSRMVPTVAPAA